MCHTTTGPTAAVTSTAPRARSSGGDYGVNSSSVHHMFTFAPASISRISKSRKYANNKFTRSVCEQHYKDLTIVRPTPPTPPPHYHSSSSPHQELRFHHLTGQTPSSPMSATSVSSTVTSSSSSFSPTAFVDCTSTSSNGSYSSTQPRAEGSQVDVMNPDYFNYNYNGQNHQKPKVQYQFVHYGQDEKQQAKWDHPVMEPVIQERKISSSGYASHWVITPSPPSFSSPSAMPNGKDSFKLQQQLSATAALSGSSLSLRNRRRKTRPLLASPSSTDVPLQLPMSPSLSLSAQQKSILSDFCPMANQQSTSNNMTISPTQLLTPIGGDGCCDTVDVNKKVQSQQSQHKTQDLSIIDAMYSVLQSSFSTRSQQQEQQEQQQKEYEEKSYSTMGGRAPQTTTTTTNNSNSNSNRGRTVISINELLN